MAIALNGSTNVITPVSAVQPTGAILQVVQTVKTDTFSLTSTADFADITGLSVNITPSSTSSKILVMLYLVVGSGNIPTTRIMRDSTAIGIGDAAGDRIQCTTGGYSIPNNYLSGAGTAVFLDSPSTTSQITYKAQLSPEHSSHTVYINRSPNDTDNYQGYRSISTITVMEVSG